MRNMLQMSSQVKELFGDRVKSLATGGTPTPPNHLQFARELCIESEISMVDSYGTTEAGVITADGRQLGSKFVEITTVLLDVPELGFTSADKPFPRGEVVIRTPTMSLGYYGDPEKQRAAFLNSTAPVGEGIYPQLGVGRWYRTGDIVSIDNTGLVTILERISACVSTAAGKVTNCSQWCQALASHAGRRRSSAEDHASPIGDAITWRRCSRPASSNRCSRARRWYSCAWHTPARARPLDCR